LGWETGGFLDPACSILIPRSASPPVIRDKNRMRFYEKVIKVKADVAALLIFFSDVAVTSRVAWRAVKGAVFWRSS
jgi:hypothetical protein